MLKGKYTESNIKLHQKQNKKEREEEEEEKVRKMRKMRKMCTHHCFPW